MKNLNSLWIGLAAIALVATGCAKDAPVDRPEPNENGQLVVNLQTAKAGTRSIFDLTGALGTALLDFENAVYNFTIYVFNEAGNWERTVVAPANSKTAVITGLDTTTKKRIVVIANGDNMTNSVMPAYGLGTTWDNFAEGYLDIRDQIAMDLFDVVGEVLTPASKGLLMTGEYDADTATPAVDLFDFAVEADGNITIPVERVVAKVELGEITFGPDVMLGDLLHFGISGASVQRVANQSPILPYPADILNATPASFYGGYDGSISEPLAGLKDDGGLINDLLKGILQGLGSIPVAGTIITAALSFVDWTTTPVTEIVDAILGILDTPLVFAPGTVGDILNTMSLSDLNGMVESLVTSIDIGGFWYVLPNTSTTNSTLMTLAGSYNGTDYYYPFEINGPEATVTGSNGATLNDYVKRNTIYRLNVEFEGNFVGSDDPDVPGDFETINVTIEPVDWLGPVEQAVKW